MTAVRDKPHFRQRFQDRFGDPDKNSSVYHEASIKKYQGVLPDELLQHWQKDGWCSYKRGIFWLVNPEEYASLMRDYLQGSVFQDRKDLYVVARTAFGKLFLWEKGKGNTLIINPMAGMIFLSADNDRQVLSAEDEEFEMNWFLGTKDPESLDRRDASGKGLFERALKKFGQLKSNEMYGYKLSRSLGGHEGIRNIDKVDLPIYFDIERQLKNPTVSVSDIENNTVTY